MNGWSSGNPERGSTLWFATPRRTAILLVFLTTIYVPLRTALKRVSEETTVRRVVLSEMRRAFPEGSVVSQRLDLSPEGVRIELVTAGSLSPQEREQLRQKIAARSGRAVGLSVQEVARKEDVLELSKRLTAVPVTAPDLEGARQQILSTIQSALTAAWPQQTAPLVDYSLDLRSSGMQLRLTYLSGQPLGPAGEEAVRRAVGARVGASLDCSFDRIEPRVNLYPWRRSLRRTPAAAEKALAGLSDVLRRFPSLTCAIFLPPRAGLELGEAVVNEIQKQGVDPKRLRIETSSAGDPEVYALLAGGP